MVTILSSWVVKIIWIELQNLPGSPGPWRGTYSRAPTTNSTAVTDPLVGFGMGSQRWTRGHSKGPEMKVLGSGVSHVWADEKPGQGLWGRLPTWEKTLAA